MNAGAAAAQGEILAFLHADTLLGPAHLAALRRAAAKTPPSPPGPLNWA